MSTGLLRSSTRRWRRPTGLVIARSMQSCIGSRGEILLKRDPANVASAEEAFLTAIAIAQPAEGAELRIACGAGAGEKVDQSTARPVEAHDILAPALEGFEPTPEMPEIAEGLALLAALAETDEMHGRGVVPG